MSKPLTIETKVRFRRQPGTKGRVASTAADVPQPPPPESIPRIARLMALAIHFDRLIREGVVENYADLARLGGVSRARITQIMDLLNLAPESQESLLDAPKQSISEHILRSRFRHLLWKDQRAIAAEDTGSEADCPNRPKRGCSGSH